ncbi:MAG: Gfo/Idh/MocA family oxidoreductase [Clostridiales bacterium]|nr:Gfo/Idh/MocA family oxidoreductase [Clostridiales bacterium]
MRSKKTIGAAVIGYGGMGGWHAEKIKETEGLELIGIYDILSERCDLSESKGIRAFCSREELLADERIELVTIATPNDVHKEIAIDALRAGKNVICEKPVAMNSEELEEMIAVAEETGKLFTVHQNRRWDEDYLTAKRIIDENALGRVYNIESRVQGDRGVPGDWRNRKAQGGGMVLDWGVHLLDQVLMIKEKQKLISVYAQLTFITSDEVDDGFRTMLTFDDDTTAYVEVTTSNFIKLPRWYILGENGSALIEDWELNGEIIKVSDWENREAVPVLAGAGLTKTMAPRTDDTIEKYPLPTVKADWGEYYKNIVAALRGEDEALITHDQIRRSTKLMEAIFESAAKNTVVKFE